MTQPTTLEEAALAQLALGDNPGAANPKWRSYSLKEGFEMREVFEYGLGFYPVNVVTGEVCKFDGIWCLDEQVLLCKNCFEDGT